MMTHGNYVITLCFLNLELFQYCVLRTKGVKNKPVPGEADSNSADQQTPRYR